MSTEIIPIRDFDDLLAEKKLVRLLNLAKDYNATDIHLVVNMPPVFRIHGELSVTDLPVLKKNDVREIIFELMTVEQQKYFEESKDIDLSFIGDGSTHFRMNAYVEKKNHMAANIRIIPSHIPPSEELGLPPIIEKFALKRKGLVLIVGSAGSGKSTTLNYMVDTINNERRCKIVMIEDPIEYIHESKKSLIIQREVGNTTKTFASSLKFALRQDPDVVVVGEIRDAESISMALTAAETGHLVLTTLHAGDAVESINRILDVYPAEQQHQIRCQIAENLVGIIGQTLIPLRNRVGRVLASEILVTNIAIRNIIRRGALLEIRGQMATKENGMFTLEQSLSDMVERTIVTKEYAQEFTKYPHLVTEPAPPPKKAETPALPASKP